MKFLFFVLLISSASSNALDEMVSVSEGSYFSESFCFKRRCEHKDVSKIIIMLSRQCMSKISQNLVTGFSQNTLLILLTIMEANGILGFFM